MKEKPILFTTPMVKTILSKQKNQTRRTNGLDEINKNPNDWMLKYFDGGAIAVNSEGPINIKCPYGKAGDKLWVRETFSTDFANYYPNEKAFYRADNDRKNEIEKREGVKGIFSPEHNEFVSFKWRPSIFMPRSLSRINLEITNVRVERLQDISEADAIAEGVSPDIEYSKDVYDGLKPQFQYIPAYKNLWNSINGKGSWDSNPWVWIIEFKKEN